METVIPKKPVRPCKQLTCTALFGAPERTRTFTGEPPLEPESSASTNSATSAHGLVRTGVIMHSGGGLATIFLHMKENIFQGLFPPRQPGRHGNDIRASQILPYAVVSPQHQRHHHFRLVNETREKPLLNRFEVMEMGFGLCTLAAVVERLRRDS